MLHWISCKFDLHHKKKPKKNMTEYQSHDARVCSTGGGGAHTGSIPWRCSQEHAYFYTCASYFNTLIKKKSTLPFDFALRDTVRHRGTECGPQNESRDEEQGPRVHIQGSAGGRLRFGQVSRSLLSAGVGLKRLHQSCGQQETASHRLTPPIWRQWSHQRSRGAAMNAFYSWLHADFVCHAAQMGVLFPSTACMFKLSIMGIFVHVCTLSMKNPTRNFSV